MWNKTAVRAHNAVLATATKHKDALATLAEMAKYMPAFAERIAELEAMRDNLERATRIAIAVDPKGD